MPDQILQLFLNEWSQNDTLRTALELLPLVLPVVIWAVFPRPKKSGQSLLILFSFFVGLHALFTAYSLIFQTAETAALYGWKTSRFLSLLGSFHAAAGVGLLICLALGRPEWTKGILITLALYAASSGILHLMEAVANKRLSLTHLGPPLWHDILAVFLTLWVLKKAEGGPKPIYYVPR